MDDVRLGGHDQRASRHRLGVVQNAAGGTDIIRMIHNRRRAFRVGGDRRAGMLGLQLQQLGFRKRLVDDAHAGP